MKWVTFLCNTNVFHEPCILFFLTAINAAAASDLFGCYVCFSIFQLRPVASRFHLGTFGYFCVTFFCRWCMIFLFCLSLQNLFSWRSLVGFRQNSK